MVRPAGSVDLAALEFGDLKRSHEYPQREAVKVEGFVCRFPIKALI
jgi:hypothetical protein